MWQTYAANGACSDRHARDGCMRHTRVACGFRSGWALLTRAHNACVLCMRPPPPQRSCGKCFKKHCSSCLPHEHRMPTLTHDAATDGTGSRATDTTVTPRHFRSCYLCTPCLAASCGLDGDLLQRNTDALRRADKVKVGLDTAAGFSHPEAVVLAKLCEAGCVLHCHPPHTPAMQLMTACFSGRGRRWSGSHGAALRADT